MEYCQVKTDDDIINIRLLFCSQSRLGQLLPQAYVMDEERDPRMHMKADLNSEKLSLHRSQNRVLLYGWSRFLAMRVAMHLYTTVAIGPMPPDVEKTSGEKEPCSTSLILSS